MDTTQSNSNSLVWKDAYSVNVKEIDDQHKKLIDIINLLIQEISSTPKEEKVKEIISELLAYKVAHFATEEKYFHQFGYVDTEAHERAHQGFDAKVKEIQATHDGNIIALAFALVDFLEDWFFSHLMNTDKQYMQCFSEHGLK